MTRQHDRTGIDVNDPPTDSAARLRLKADTAKTGYVDGAWWPYSDDLSAELPVLLGPLAVRLDPVHRVAYHVGEWATAPSELAVDGRTVRLDGHRYGTGHTIEVVDTADRRLVLLVVPLCTDAHDAQTTIMSAASTENASTVDQLLTGGAWPPTDRTERSAPAQQWWNREFS